MSYDPSQLTPAAFDPAGGLRTSSKTKLFGGKVLNAEDSLLWDTKGTGTATWANSGVNLVVTAGQYLVRQAKYFCPYFEGNPQKIEATFDNFVNQANVVKRAGYFSSSAVAPYNTNYDGVWIEATGASYKLCVANNGTLNLDLDWTLWDNYAAIQNYDWSAFTVAAMDFLWLGGTELRLFLKMPTGGFLLVHTFKWAGVAGHTGPFIRSPQHPVRYEIRSSTGIGSLNSICSEVSSEGSIAEVGASRSIFNATAITTNAVGTVYALKGVRALASRRDLNISVAGFAGGIVAATADSGTLLLLLNPTLSAPLTWTSAGLFEEGTATTQTISSLGTVVDSVPLVGSADGKTTARNILSRLPVGIDNVMGELILAYIPTTANQTVTGNMLITA